MEAARAGQAGSGFRVVAEEVRRLAQRSADAAHQSAELIEEAVRKSGAGEARLGQVVAATHSIVERVQKIRGLVDRSSAASQEQAGGIAQVSTSPADINRTARRTSESAAKNARTGDESNEDSERLNAILADTHCLIFGAAVGAGRRRHVEPRTPRRRKA